ncbi:hypothetical protein ACFVRD_41080 [Streptomyces sp. NPDC057908]|uniref:hypothetical protein n=1 Tax=Streptomyces sp. NPDC057908 TaxID=3346276 RepID=UPI0036E3837D
MTKKSKLTADEHADLGRRLAVMRDELSHIHVQLSGAYAQTGPASLPAKKIVAARKALDEARSGLENALYQEYPESAATTVYYPHPEDRTSATD